MQVEFQNTLEEFRNFFKSYRRKTLLNIFFRIIATSLFLCCALFFEHFTWWKLGFYFAGSVIVLLFITRITPLFFSFRKFFKALSLEKEEPKAKKITIFQEGLNVDSNGKMILYKWEDLVSCQIHNSYLYVLLKSGSFFLIPKNVFLKIEEYQNFQNILKFEATKNSSSRGSAYQKFLKKPMAKWILTVCFLLFMVKGCIFSQMKFILEQDLPQEKAHLERQRAREQCLNLFTKEAQSGMNHFPYPSDFQISKSQHPFCTMNYGKYNIVIHQVNISENSTLQKIILAENKNYKPDVGISRGWGDGTSGYGVRFSFDHDSSADAIILSYNGSLSDKNFFGDSIVNYYLVATKLSFRYESDGDPKLTFESKQSNIYEFQPRKLKANISFYKKGKSVFIIVLSEQGKNDSINNLTLPHLLGVKTQD